MDEDILKAEKKVEHIQQTPELKAKYDARFKQLTDESNRLETAKNEGIKEGTKEGYEEGLYKERKNTVKKLVEKGWSLEKIEETFGYDPKYYL